MIFFLNFESSDVIREPSFELQDLDIFVVTLLCQQKSMKKLVIKDPCQLAMILKAFFTFFDVLLHLRHLKMNRGNSVK